MSAEDQPENNPAHAMSHRGGSSGFGNAVGSLGADDGIDKALEIDLANHLSQVSSPGLALVTETSNGSLRESDFAFSTEDFVASVNTSTSSRGDLENQGATAGNPGSDKDDIRTETSSLDATNPADLESLQTNNAPEQYSSEEARTVTDDALLSTVAVTALNATAENGTTDSSVTPTLVAADHPLMSLVEDVIGPLGSVDPSDAFATPVWPATTVEDGVTLTGLDGPALEMGTGLTFVFNDTGGAGVGTEARTAFEAAAALWSTLVTDNVEIRLDIGFTALDPGVLGQAQSTNSLYFLNSVTGALSTDATSADDAAAVNQLPVGSTFDFVSQEEDGSFGLDNDASTDNSTLAITQANAKALGFTTDDAGRTFGTTRDAAITFSSLFTWDFDRSDAGGPNDSNGDGIDNGAQDFIGVAFHEIGHSLGFTSGVDSVDFNASQPVGSRDNLDGFVVFSALDLFRYSANSVNNFGGVQDLGYGSTSYFSLDGGATNLGLFSTGSFNGDGQQASHWKDNLGLGILDPTANPAGSVNNHTALDLLALDVVGWDLASAAVAVELFNSSNVSIGTFTTIQDAVNAASPSNERVVVNAASYTANPEVVAVAVDGLTFDLPAGVTPTLTLSDPTAINLTLAGDGAATVNGDGAANTITGNNGNNIVRGFAANDVISGGGGNDRIDGGDYIGPTSAQSQVYRLYGATLDREPDAGGFASWTAQLDAGATLESITSGFVNSTEFQNTYGSLDNTQFVTLLYNNVLDRAPDSGGLASWVNMLDNGASRESVVNGFSESGEYQGITEFLAAAFVQGAAGYTSHMGQVYRLYQATLDRAPDEGGFQGWVGQLDGGAELVSITTGFINSTEFSNVYGSLNNNDFVTLLYNNVLNRPPDSGGLASWVNMLDNGTSRETVVNGFSESQEFINNTEEPIDTFVRGLSFWTNILDGDAGANDILGGRGADTYVFDQPDNGTESIYNLQSWDVLDFNGFGYANPTLAKNNITANGTDAIFSDQGVTVIFKNTDVAFIEDDMFI